MKCPVCGAELRTRKTGQAVRCDSSQVMRVTLIQCPNCGNGKSIVTHEVSFFSTPTRVSAREAEPNTNEGFRARG